MEQVGHDLGAPAQNSIGKISNSCIDGDQQHTIQQGKRSRSTRYIIIGLGLVFLLSIFFLIQNRPITTTTYDVDAIQVSLGKHLPSPLHVDGAPTFFYPTVGVPQPGKTFNDTPVPREGFIEFDTQVDELLKPYNDTDCQLVKYGDGDDGSYLVCKNYLKRSEALVNIGINGYDDLGCKITTQFPMPNYQYDCTNHTVPKCQKNRGANVFAFVCVGEKTEKTNQHTFHTLEDILRSHNLIRKPITLKIDAEGGQFPGLKYFPTEYLDYIDQILMEIHFQQIAPQRWGNLDIIKTLASKFVNVNYHTPYWLCYGELSKDNRRSFRRMPGIAIQVTLINRNIVKLKSESRSYAMHPLNFKGCLPQE